MTRLESNTRTGRSSARSKAGAPPRSELRRARKRRGLSIEDVSQQARIPRRYLVALERGDVDVLPHGRFRSGYHRQYRSFLGLPPMAEGGVTRQAAAPEVTAEVTGTTGTLPRFDEVPILRLVASGFAFTLLVVLVLKVGAVVVGSPPTFFNLAATPADAAPVDAPIEVVETSGSFATPADDEAPSVTPVTPAVVKAQSVVLRAIEDVRVGVTTDQGNIRRGVLPGGESVTIDSDGPITLDIADLTRVRVRYNGSRLEPLHNLSKGRRLVFLPEPTP